ncbi:MAG: hypothetical protein JXK07_08265, partial [Spirochaetes bacterium]|nr:hypothetical protein [Spirochaetota bacterium]
MSKKVFTIITIFLMLSGFGLSQIRKDGPSTTPQRLTYTASDSIEAVFAYSIANSTVHMAYVEDEKLYYRRS